MNKEISSAIHGSSYNVDDASIESEGSLFQLIDIGLFPAAISDSEKTGVNSMLFFFS